MASRETKPPKPSMAEIERLVDAALEWASRVTRNPSAENMASAGGARAALLAAIRAYGEGE